MKPLQEMIFLGEIVFQIKVVQRAATRLEDRTGKYDSIDKWSSIQTILIAAANVSKILWPRDKYESRGEYLRKLIKVDRKSVLSDRKFRNHFEHYDERIELWFKDRSSAVYSDLAFTAKTSNSILNFPSNHHRNYDHISQVLTFRGEELDLGAVLKELEEIRNNCKPFVLTRKNK